MLIIFALAALALVAVCALVFGLPLVIVVAVVRARTGRRDAPEELPSARDAAFVELISREWPLETSRLHGSNPTV